MLTLSAQQIERLNALMILGGFQSENELFNEMLANFEYQQQLRELRKSIHAGLNSGEFEEVKNIPAFFTSLKDSANHG
ncbi:hypothetical protein HYE60_04745 [Aggregatibacter actinomycetemcomitans]|uniref:hypothetical protein n=1 Tax=Aggregatibacter actinomycetemcomitans TaxID=714 RepID=UPI00197BFBDA|nr:hypothetical protein [Aggregatibacter actinomycetemcomitans]MBN6074558.1 hypothetical protein [Aggregatibacter actinomycetemcomitans]